MYFSGYNIFSQIRDSKNFFLINALSKNADILNPEKAEEIIKGNYTDIEEYIQKGYMIDEDEERKRYNKLYKEFLELRERSEIQIFYVPHYDCNFDCSYCYQDEYSNERGHNFQGVTDAFFNYIEENFNNKHKYITLFGGEPLLSGQRSKDKIAYFIEKAQARKIDIAVVTNGYNLADHIDILSKVKIREIQVTLDGTENVHNRRRPLRGGGATFDEIVEGIDRALEAGIPINLRMVLDKDNIKDLPDFSDFAIEKGWVENPIFKTQLGRNYELHHCRKNSSSLFSRIELYEKVYELIEEYPQILKFHRPAYSISKFLLENGDMPEPLFDSCPGCKTEWAFDYTGRIYSCTATVGKEGEALGAFYPEKKLNENDIKIWKDRDVTTLEECRICSLQLLCGGGCAAAAKNRTGSIMNPDCRPVKELLEMGISLYFEKGVING